MSAAKGHQDASLPECYRASFAAFVERAIGSAGVDEVATRFARNIANGRWLWRNRTLARALAINTTLAFNGNGQTLSFDALSIPTRRPDPWRCPLQCQGMSMQPRFCIDTRAALQCAPAVAGGRLQGTQGAA